MTVLDALSPLTSRSTLFSYLTQEAFSRRAGGGSWSMDTKTSELSFEVPTGQLTFAAEMIASIAPGPRSILWGWAHPQGNPAGAAARLRDVGVAHGITELAQEEFAFPEQAPVPSEGDEESISALHDWIAQAAHDIGMAAVAATDKNIYYSAPIGGGSRAVFLLVSQPLNAEPPIEPVTLTSLVTSLPRILSAGLLHHRTAIEWLAARLGWNAQWSDDVHILTVNDGDQESSFTFDSSGRVTDIKGSIRSGQ